MSLEDFYNILKTTGLPVVYRAFSEEDVPKLPYICYLNPKDNNFAADGKVFFSSKELQVELYTKNKEIETEERVEQALSSFFYQKTENYIDSEK